MQTHDDDLDKDSQTDDITSRDKWTQHPTGVDLKPFGGRSEILETGIKDWHLDLS